MENPSEKILTSFGINSECAKNPEDQTRKEQTGEEQAEEVLIPVAEAVPRKQTKIIAGCRRRINLNDIEYVFRWCPAGSFMMGRLLLLESMIFFIFTIVATFGGVAAILLFGTTIGLPLLFISFAIMRRLLFSEPAHKVTLSQGGWLLEHEVTQEMWESVIGNNPSQFKGSRLPVERVSWNDCQDFIKKLQELAPSGMTFRLPTEAEWEYACRVGSKGAYGGTGNLNEMGWYKDNSDSTTHEVKTKSPNDAGLYDMHGNVYEWCSDWYGVYPNKDVTDPQGSKNGSKRIIRGGSWNNSVKCCKSGYRGHISPEFSGSNIGFRLLLSSSETK